MARAKKIITRLPQAKIYFIDDRPGITRALANHRVAVVTVLPAGASYRLIAGPVCADQLVWFKIDSPSGWMTFAILVGDDLFLVPH